MSFVTETWLQCDDGSVCRLVEGEPRGFGIDEKAMGLTAARLREKAKSSDGWTRKGGKDICDECSKRPPNE